MRKANRRHGFVLVVVVMLAALTAGLLAVIGTWGAYRYRGLRAERVRQVTRAVSDSAVSYARVHLDEWKKSPPPTGIDLEVSSLAPAGMTASSSISFVVEDGRRLCRISSRVDRGSLAAADTADIPLGPAPATAPTASTAPGL